MAKIRIYKGKTRDEMVDIMSESGFTKWYGLLIPDNSNIKVGDSVELPKEGMGGLVVEARRCVFLFWRYEYLLEQRTRDGLFYSWYAERDLDFFQ